ncbi:MAG: FkbM family methyltransferase [Chloroflexi bacterium]|nr:FkbM family methyltransferase [Chloroflexota bacterium]
MVPILLGKLRGKRWITGSHIHGCWLGVYELAKRRVFERMVKPGMVVFDIGANAGFYTLLASTLVGEGGKVYAFEPVPRNLHYLRRHLALNAVHNVTVLEAAVSDRDGFLAFRESLDGAQGKIDEGGSLTVHSVTLDRLVDDSTILPPSCLKIDKESTGTRKREPFES